MSDTIVDLHTTEDDFGIQCLMVSCPLPHSLPVECPGQQFLGCTLVTLKGGDNSDSEATQEGTRQDS
ncbi:hypothetical protein O3P69_002504 [Scylla paramamosain]|uniref:Uncharacterized protein n=1 Tax=Scylla paramamosain TaxID=85552 RepID=A0AAW0UP33_SCYPA